MAQTFYFSLLVLCAIFAQSMAIVSEDNLEETSNLHVRKKRLIDTTSQNPKISFHYAPYIVNLLKNGVSHCGATILSFNIALTAGHCFNDKQASYIVLSGSALRNGGSRHSIIKVLKHKNYNPHTLSFDLAMFKVSPNFVFGLQFNRAVQLHKSVVPPGTLGTFAGWGCTRNMPQIFPDELRAIHIPIIHPRYCQEHYRTRNVQILDQHVCALDKTGNKGSCAGDDGGPLVVDGNQLVGIFSHRNGGVNGQNPEVFVNVVDREIQAWILRTMNNNENWFGLPEGHSKYTHS